MSYKTEAERREDAPSKGELALQEAVDNANRRTWWADHQNIHFLVEYLHGPMNTTDTYALDVSDVLDILEKPWHFTEEFVHAMIQYTSDNELDFDYEMARSLGATRVTVQVIEVPDFDEPVDEDIFRGAR